MKDKSKNYNKEAYDKLLTQVLVKMELLIGCCRRKEITKKQIETSIRQFSEEIKEDKKVLLLDFKAAFEMLYHLHEQNGDNHGWANCREEAEHATRKYENAEEWIDDMYRRSDLSQDKRWDLECFDESFKVLFALMGKY